MAIPPPPSPSFSSSGKNFRIIEIQVKSATLISQTKGNFYVCISINESQQELKTKVVNSNTPSSSWNQKFVFFVPQDFIFNGNSMVSFTIFKARRFFPDIPIGKATAEMKALFPIGDHNNIIDDEDDDGPEIQEEENFEFRAEVVIPILKEESSTAAAGIGTLTVCIVAWEKYFPYEVKLHGRATKSFDIFSGSEKIGSMILQKALQVNYMSFVGDDVFKRPNLGMEFEEFMMLQEAEKPPKTSSTGISIRNFCNINL